MNKRYAFLLFTVYSLLLTGLLSGCGGGSSAPANVPPGENPGIASVVQLKPAQYIAQTNSYITLHAKVLDGNGIPIANMPVTFTNLSSVGYWVTATASAVKSSVSASTPTVANTDSSGIATVNLYSTTTGFVVVDAQVNTGVGNVRDQKVVYFTSNDVLAVSMALDVDSVPGNGIYNETNDITLFQNTTDDTVQVRATVYNAGGVPVAGTSVAWSSDQTGDAVNFLAGTEPQTNTNGQAVALVQVLAASIRNAITHLNILAYAGNGAASMVSLFLQPVIIDTTNSYVTATPTTVNVNATSAITAIVKLTTGQNAPDGIAVQFTTTCGTVTPFAQTTGGIATATFTAPQTIPTGGTCTVTAKVSGTTVGTVAITITMPLSVQPAAQTVTAGSTATFTIYGGIPSYSVFSNNPAYPPSPSTVTSSGGTFTVTVPLTAAAASVTYTIRDSAGTTVTATLTITAASTSVLKVVPASQTLSSPIVGATAAYTVSGGTAPYTAYSNNPAVATVAVVGSTMTATVASVPITNTTVTFTIYDAVGNSVTATLVINVTAPGTMTLTPPSQTIINPIGGDSVTYTVSGGTPPYTVYVDFPFLGFITASVSVSTVTVAVATVPTSSTAATFTVYDSTFLNSVSGTLMLQVTPLAVSPSSITVTGLNGATTADNVKFTITGGTPGATGYSMFSDNNAVIPSVGALGVGVTTFTINPIAVSASTTVTLTVQDSVGATTTATVTVTPSSASLAINPSAIDMTAGSTTTFYIIGGVGPFNVLSGDATKATVSGGVPVACAIVTAGSSLNCPVGTISFTVNAVLTGSSTITVVDTGNGKSATSTVAVH